MSIRVPSYHFCLFASSSGCEDYENSQKTFHLFSGYTIIGIYKDVIF
ncbi:hypothetical protein HMPREF0262_02258 [Clostridium sp. ATCC 29733]|nr:hypothetical protein HMPREF0262_02258 [Clostridium sp. ATCC 29733]